MKPLKLKKLHLGMGVPKICVSITESDPLAIVAFAGQILTTSADIVEWRLDYFDEINDSEKIRETANLLHNILGDLPLIVSLRNPSEGGHQTVSDAAYQQLISQLITSHTANAVEINWSRPAPIRQQLANLARVNQVLTLGSYYSIQNTPDYDHLVQILTHLVREQTNFLKLTTMPQNDQDVLNLMSANLTVSEKIDQPISTIALGPKGTATRIAGHTFHSVMTYADLKRSSVPGHLSVEETRQFLNAMDETGLNVRGAM